ncbi:DNA repair protein RadA [Candidatus Falkowbacteria bacterium]|jgi:DNA repair protein RadA/Sms|nr:DNA repair protein RadA [Candidatus Falkowbacteria bacterium]
MSKHQTIFSCYKCGAQFPKWSGQCFECQAWGTIKEGEENAKKQESKKAKKLFNTENLIDINKVSNEHFDRLKIKMREIDTVFGGGIVKGSITLIGGEPGIGKSTLSLQLFKQLEGDEEALLYISGEESASQIKLRMDRLDYSAKNLKFLSETNVEQIQAAIETVKPKLAIIDSIQTIHSNQVESEPGNVAQIRACTVKLMEVAKQNNIPVIITGHVTKDGSVAGPKTLEHLVDTVLYLEGDKLHGYRILRSTKNRFGSTNEVGILEMTDKGLQEVEDPSKAFLDSSTQNTAGSVISCFAEGNRVFFCEVQALVSPTIFGYPQRKTAGYDLNRLQMISAVLLKRARLNLTNQDIHLNIVGGFKIKEPAIDLSVALAIYSALKDKPIPKNTVVIGELGLGGEIRSVFNLEKRINEAEKLGFAQVIIPDVKINKDYKIKITRIKEIGELMKV